MELNEIKHIGVLGAGLMGHGIAQIFASAGYDVSIYDTDPAALQAARGRIADNFNVFVELKLARPEDRDRCIERIRLCPSMEALANGPQFVIEAIAEDLEIKSKAYARLERCAPRDAIFASNTSAISITALGATLKSKHRFLGTHFWNPPHVLPCVEVIKGADTDPAVFETVYALMAKVGKVPVRVLKDVPGFLGNRLQHAMWREAISLLENNIASAEDIDKVVKYGFGARMPFIGPLETADLAGLGLTRDIHRYLFPYLESSREPSPVLEDLVASGATGVRSGRGFYEWPPEKVQQIIRQRDGILLRIIHEIVSLAGQRSGKDTSKVG
jgi:3-hydroxybutyryl-CoA dehydrogenase